MLVSKESTFLQVKFLMMSDTNAKFFGRLFAERHLPKKYHLVKTKIKRKNRLVDFSFVPHLKAENKETFGLLQTMFELSSSIGAYVLYVLIQAMSSENKAIRSKGKIDDTLYENMDARSNNFRY